MDWTAVLVALAPTITIIVTYLLNTRQHKQLQAKVEVTHDIVERRNPAKLRPKPTPHVEPHPVRRAEDHTGGWN